MTFEDLCAQLQCTTDTFAFTSLLALIDAHYNFSPTAFQNGSLQNAENENNGSCKLFQFAKLHGFSQDETLRCFGEHYREVLADPAGENHQNIRQFMMHGWEGIHFPDKTLLAKK